MRGTKKPSKNFFCPVVILVTFSVGLIDNTRPNLTKSQIEPNSVRSANSSQQTFTLVTHNRIPKFELHSLMTNIIKNDGPRSGPTSHSEAGLTKPDSGLGVCVSDFCKVVLIIFIKKLD
jgi:hypothetical protein